MKHSGILAAVFCLAMASGAQAAASQRDVLTCDNDGRCIQRIVAAAPRAAKNPRHRGGAKVRLRGTIDASGNPARLITVPSAAGIDITVATDFSGKILAFIADLKARGYTPRRISCYSWAASHVANSLHHSGEACDFDQRGWGRTAAAMYHVADLARAHGLHNGCSFGDCGHIDSGRRMAGARQPWPRMMVARTP